MKTVLNTMMILVLVALLAGCETTPDAESLSEDQAAQDAGTTGAGRPGSGEYGAESQGFESGQGYAAYPGGSLDDPRSPLSKRVIYFMYDSAEISPEYIEIIDAHARYLSTHPEIQVTLEGHADERGSREYNIALGEQRANSVFRKLGIQGVGESQVSIVSYGEEKPEASGHDESSWQKNRRVEIRYPGY